ncbi:MAG: hypothetical protein QME45_10360 [Clostridiales bacterium]|nr:hypothetical protein [Clostridiales bacterium]HBM79821.1 hypothetical protein [Clostridiaceae bacterium]
MNLDIIKKRLEVKNWVNDILNRIAYEQMADMTEDERINCEIRNVSYATNNNPYKFQKKADYAEFTFEEVEDAIISEGLNIQNVTKDQVKSIIQNIISQRLGSQKNGSLK